MSSLLEPKHRAVRSGCGDAWSILCNALKSQPEVRDQKSMGRTSAIRSTPIQPHTMKMSHKLAHKEDLEDRRDLIPRGGKFPLRHTELRGDTARQAGALGS